MKDNSNNTPSQAPSIINISNIRKVSPNTVTHLVPSNGSTKQSSQFISKTINNNTPNLGLKVPKLKVIDYVSELQLINDYLKLTKYVDGKLNEVKTIAGKCYLCEHKTVYDLLQHFKYQHNASINNKRFETSCLLCGLCVESREELIAHQYDSHKIIAFVSLNKVFTLSRIENSEKERKELEAKIKEFKTPQLQHPYPYKLKKKHLENSQKLNVSDADKSLTSQSDDKICTTMQQSDLNDLKKRTISAITIALETQAQDMPHSPPSLKSQGSTVSIYSF